MGTPQPTPPTSLGYPLGFGSYFFSCRPSPKPSLLDGWKTSMDGSAERERRANRRCHHCPHPEGLWGHCPARPHSPGPSRYWEREKRRRRTMGSVRSTFHAVATSSCQGRAAIWRSSQGGKFGTPPSACVPLSPCQHHGDTLGTHIEEADVHVEVNVHVVDGPVLPVRHAAGGRGEVVPRVTQPRVTRGGRREHPPDGHGILAVDLLHRLDVGVQLRVPVQIGGAGPLRHSASGTVTPPLAALGTGRRLGVPEPPPCHPRELARAALTWTP